MKNKLTRWKRSRHSYECSYCRTAIGKELHKRMELLLDNKYLEHLRCIKLGALTDKIRNWSNKENILLTGAEIKIIVRNAHTLADITEDPETECLMHELLYDGIENKLHEMIELRYPTESEEEIESRITTLLSSQDGFDPVFEGFDDEEE